MKQVAPITLPGGFLETATSTADLASCEGSAFIGSGSPDGVFF